MTYHITRQEYAVQLLVDGKPGPELVVDVIHGDRMRAELEGRKHGLGDLKATPMNYSTLWVWCSLTRHGLYDQPYVQFKTTDLVDLAPIAKETPVDPTSADPSA